MKTIKIFLASSEELSDDRNAFGNLVRRLDKIYEKRGIRIELFEWEDYDAAYNDRRKQDEYNDQIKASDMFLALFHTKAGKFTIEEFDVATEEFKKHASPKVYTYCKDLKEGEQESPELTEFKRRLFNEMGHYWSRYNNRDSMQLHFVLQLQLLETSGTVEKLKLENGTVTLEGMPIAKIDNLQFAAGNVAYQKMSVEFATLPEKIEKARQRVEKFPDDKDLIDDLQQKQNRFNKLKEEFSQIQKSLFETAQRIASMQLEQVSDMLRRAIEAFEDGKLELANILLDEIAHEAEHHMAQLEQQRSLVHQDIEAFLLQAKTVMADASIPIDERIDKTATIYSKADDWAQKSALPEEKYETLLVDYESFLSDYAHYDKALSINQRLTSIRERLYGLEHPDTATSYNNIGYVYKCLGDYDKALEYYSKDMAICEKVLGKEHPDTATSYNNIGGVYYSLGDYDKALEYYFKALAIREKVIGKEHPDTATSYNNIGYVYKCLGDYDKALEYYSKDMAINEKVLGKEHPDTATSYNNIGNVYDYIDDDKALEYHFKGLNIFEKVLGREHPSTATSYNNIGNVYDCIGDYEKAIECYSKALAIRENVLGPEHPDTATSYNDIGYTYENLGEYSKALEYYSKALDINERFFGSEHPNSIDSYNNVGATYEGLENYSKAIEFYSKALLVREKLYGEVHKETAKSYKSIGNVYEKQGNYIKALEFYSKALAIRKEILGSEHPDTKSIQENVDVVKQLID